MQWSEATRRDYYREMGVDLQAERPVMAVDRIVPMPARGMLTDHVSGS